jgi:hypothetical protein
LALTDRRTTGTFAPAAAWAGSAPIRALRRASFALSVRAHIPHITNIAHIAYIAHFFVIILFGERPTNHAAFIVIDTMIIIIIVIVARLLLFLQGKILLFMQLVLRRKISIVLLGGNLGGHPTLVLVLVSLLVSLLLVLILMLMTVVRPLLVMRAIRFPNHVWDN